MTTQRSVNIIGGGTAAASVALTLRKQAFDGRITIVAGETLLPYERPPLSKEFLTGTRDSESLAILPAEWYDANQVELLLGVRADRLDLRDGRVLLSDSSALSFTDLVIATGGAPRTLAIPGLPDRRALYLRSAQDAHELRSRLLPGKRLVVVGAGFIGGELTASARALGAEVTMLEILPVPLGRVVGDLIGNIYADIHREHGVTLRTGVSVVAAASHGDQLELQLSDGTYVECDELAIGVGLIPDDHLARDAGLGCGNGIIVDQYGRTSAEHVFAAGDVAVHHHPLFERSMRVEHHENAIRHGAAVALNLVGANVAYEDPHWFWSDQYEHKLQGAGLVGGGNRIAVRGRPDDRRFTMFYLDDDKVVGALSMNTGTEIKHAARLISARAQVAPGVLEDQSQDLKQMVKAAAYAR
jgi:3-phenylpropionate/trans-cinnamate dioxygenase ferredoxin reductase subunit